METMRHVSEDLAKLLKQTDQEQSSVQIDLTPDGLRINIFDRSQKPIFKPGTDEFTDYGAWVFNTLAWEISRYSTFRIELEGHTESNSSTGREAHSKWELSTERANAARRKFVQTGVAPQQVCKVSGYADTQPMPGNPPEADINRRVTVMLKLKDSVDALPDDTPQLPNDTSTN